MPANSKTYALVTPAKNEDAFIERTIQAVLAQTILPEKWVIVSDGSTDRTDEIVAKYAQSHGFIDFLRAGKQGQKDFGSKVKAFRAGHELLGDIPYRFIGNLDADVTFSPDYYEQIMNRFEANPKLGVAAGGILELLGAKFVPQRGSLNSAAGSVQLFRRECYESFGGYIPIKGGGIDAAAEIMARMHGWEVQTFPELDVHHHRRMSTGSKNIFVGRFRAGVTNYLLGYHPLFHLVTCVRRAVHYPLIIGSVCSLAGYGWSWAKGLKRAMPDDAVKFLRSEQMARITPSFMPGKTIRGA